MQVGTAQPPARFLGRKAQQEVGHDEIQTLRGYWRDNPTDDGLGCAGCSAIAERRAQGCERARLHERSRREFRQSHRLRRDQRKPGNSWPLAGALARRPPATRRTLRGAAIQIAATEMMQHAMTRRKASL